MAEAGPVVLIYSDDEPVGQALRFVLGMDGVDVRLCPDAASLLASPVLREAHCLVLKDGPAGVDGCALLRAARARGARAPAILLVSLFTASLGARAAEAGVWLVLERPIMDNRLIDAIMDCVTSHRRQLLSTNT